MSPALFGARRRSRCAPAAHRLPALTSVSRTTDRPADPAPRESIMSQVPSELRYTETHEWVRDNGDGTVAVGITDHAQSALGDIVFVELPEVGKSVDAGGACAVVESVKAASDIYAPVAGEVLTVNEILAGTPETINQDPYGEGWLFTLKPADLGAPLALLDAEGYQAVADAEH
jgi:glycine cleavage system H protein